MKFFVFPYKTGSESAKALTDALDGKRVLRQGSSYVYKSDHLLINWGASDCPYVQALNSDVTEVINKITFYKKLAGMGVTPKFATTKPAALAALDFPIFCRTQTAGHDGSGIVIADDASQLVTAPLYVEGVDKTSEYRIHMGRHKDGTVLILGQQIKKKTQTQPDGLDPRIWTGDSVTLRWTLNNAPVSAPNAVLEVATKAFGAFPGLSFGALDIVYHQPSQRAYVVEINSAPIATEKTTKMYADFFKDYASKVSLPETPQTPATAAPGPLTVEIVTDNLISGQLPLKTVIQGYIQSLT